LKFFPTAEGYIEPSAGSYKYVYQYKDHLGNIRLSYDKNLIIQEENNYYPFGLKHIGHNSGINSTNTALKYKYNGKELQDELGLNMYDYGARNYDPALGRWMNIDPLAETSRRYSPYTYALDNPVFFIDPDGMQATYNWEEHDKGNKGVYTDGDKNVSFDEALSQATAESSSNDSEDPPKKKEPGFFKQLLLAVPVLGATIESSDKMGEGDYLGAALSFGVGVMDLFTLGTANKYKTGTAGVVAGVEGITAKNVSKNAGSLVKILHVEDDVMMFSSKVGKETVEGISNFTVKEGKLYLNQLHLQGSSAGKVGRESLWDMARDLGRQYNVKEVIIQGGRRTTGKYKGQIPSPITIKVH
ncbi:RHS repeat domain-containing protein, partial [Flavobacterium sp. 22076]|uniref:RHS repeat domain-containing protein n=1 Tax=Flavobacterium sp. 22076 TaxID=3453866 RepID=UPI003F8447F4